MGVSFPLKCTSRVFQCFLLFIAAKWEGTTSRPPLPHRTMPPMPPQPLPEPDTISRDRVVSKRAPKLTTNKTFTFWRNRTRSNKLTKRVLTAGDRLVQAKKHEQHRLEYHDALEHAHATIRELAEGLRNRFGKHSVDHYFNDLIHRAHKSRSTRKVNPWNAYQKLELERMKRMLLTTSFACRLTYSLSR